MFDSHCHLHDDSVRSDVDEVVARARVAGVTGYMLAGVHPEGWQYEVEIARVHPEVRIAYGVHPQIMSDGARGMVNALETALDGGLPRPSAVGEIGLDGSDAYLAALPLQEVLFVRQLELARAHDLPVLLHVLKAHPQALALLAAHPVRGVLHSCSASAELVQRYLALGLHVSFAGTVTNAKARRICAAAASVPIDRLLVETDAPFQTPVALRPARNEPAFLVEIVRALAQIRGTSEASVAAATTRNAERLFAS